MYDPILGRFLQADPFVQQPNNIQNFNRYSYVLNNPLNKTDPSGYFFQMLVVWAVQYVAAATATTAIGTALSVALTAYEYYGYAQMAIGAIKAIEGGGTAMANFAGGMAKGFIKGQIFNCVTGAGQCLAADLVNNKQGGLDTDLPSSTSEQKHSLQANGGKGEGNTDSSKGQVDISKAPKHIKMGDGVKYDDLPEAQKYAVHLAEKSLIETVKRAQLSSDPQMKGVSLESVNATWYSDPSSKGAWDGLDKAYAMGSYSAGENIQFNGTRMVDLLPGGKGFSPFTPVELKKGYFIVGPLGMKAGQGAFNYVVSHEVGHTTFINSRVSKPESNADSFYLRLLGG